MRAIFKLALLVFCITLIQTSCKKENITSTSDEELEGWELVFKDDFNGSGAPNSALWNTETSNRRNNPNGPDGWWLPETVYQNGEGQLVVEVKQIENRNNDNDEFDYASGILQSRGKLEQTFGRFQIRARLPQQSGWWAAFWLFSNGIENVNNSGEDGTEIDIMEGFGWTDNLQHALHWDGYGADHEFEEHKFEKEGIRDGFHIFALEWTESEYVFFVDGEETWRTNAGGVSKVPAWIVISGEVSTESWATSNYWANQIDADKFPDYYLIDYVRVYKKVE
jgi:beta-glucanase (GH16 family)